MSIYECQICNKLLKNGRSLSKHVTTNHPYSAEKYYCEFVGEKGKCVICGKPTTFNGIEKGYTKTCCLKCGGLYQWNKDNGDRKQSNRDRWAEKNPGGGRPKGSKNKNPYPKSEKVLKRYKDCSVRQKEKAANMSHEERCEYFGTYFKASPDKIEKNKNIATENVMKQGSSKKGWYKPRHPEKYIGDSNNIIFRSLWEKRVMEYLDNNLSVKKWASEEIVIPYVSPVDNKVRRYFPDFYVEAEDTKGNIKKMILEVKPAYQVAEPTKPKRKTKRYLSEVVTYGINQAKWKAASEFCLDHGWEFRLITENELFSKKKNK